MRLCVKSVQLRDQDIRPIYFDAFPKKERMPFFLMVLMSKLWNTQFWGFYDGDTPCGFAYFAVHRNLLFLMFLAVDNNLRSKGYGSAILAKIRDTYPDKKLIVSIEPCEDTAPDIEVRKRRKAFYQRNGYSETGYQIKLSGVVQDVLIANGEFRKCEFRLFLALYSCGTLWPRIWRKEGCL